MMVIVVNVTKKREAASDLLVGIELADEDGVLAGLQQRLGVGSQA